MQGTKHIHLIGICGTAMASLAGMLQAQGHRVTGSDASAYPPMSELLGELGIPILEPYAEANLRPAPELVVVGNAISRGNVELEYVLDVRLPFISLAQLVHDEFLAGRESLVVAGTHGKTTTTSMLAWIYEVASRRDAALAPSFLIGGVAENFGTSFRVRPTRPFVIEGDEYDTAFFDKGPKFMHYFPDAAVLTHVEFDHADIYADLAAVKTAFRRFVNLIPRRGRLVAFDGSKNVTECVADAMCRVERYGFHPESRWQMSELEHVGQGTRWTLRCDGAVFAQLALPMPGEHNALNATAAAALAAGQGIGAEVIAEALASFRSVKRRLEVRAEVGGVTVIDDFAHHPTAIRETLRALRSAYPGRRLWAVLEPRSNTLRRNVFEGDLIESLALADRSLIAAVFKSESIPEGERLHPERVAAALRALRAAYAGRRLWAVLEPRSNTLRRNVFEEALVDSLALADAVVLASVFRSESIAVAERLVPEQVAERLCARGVPSWVGESAEAIVDRLVPELRAGDVVAILSNGGFGNIYETLPRALVSREG